MKEDKNNTSLSDEVWCINAGCWMGMGVEIAETLRQRDYKDPSIVFIPANREVWSMTTEMTPKVAKDKAPALRQRDYKDPPVVIYDADTE